MNAKFIAYYEKYMSVVGPAGGAMFWIQAYKIFATQSSGSVSAQGFVLGLMACLSWFFYGLLKKDYPILISNVFAVVGICLILLGCVIY